MIQSQTKHKLLALGATVGVSLLAPSVAQAASFHFSYTWVVDPPGVQLPLQVRGMVDGDMNGNMLDNPTNIMAEVFQNNDFDNPVATFGDSDFTSRIFTFDGIGVEVVTDGGSLPALSLRQALNDNATFNTGGTLTQEEFSTDRWTLTAKVPEADMGLVSWFAVAAIGGLSLKYGKGK